MEPKTEIVQGTLTLMILKTLAVLGATHGYGIARRIEEISGEAFSLNYGTVYPALLKLEQEGFTERAVTLLRGAGYDAWINPVGHLAVDPNGLTGF